MAGSPSPFVPGWSPEAAAKARARVMAGPRYATVRQDAAYPPAWCIPALRRLEQGQAGTCWEHAGTAAAEDTAKALGLAIFPICRRLVGWQGKQFEGGGNQANGGSPTDALLAMSVKGAGIAHEALFPYTDNNAQLAQRPPESVFADARPFRLVQPVDIASDDDARRAIASSHAIANGVWWPYEWDRQGATFIDWIGRGEYGHAMEERGYAIAGVFDQYAWFNLRNWHGQLYKPLSPELAAKVPNYAPDTPTTTSDFWVRADVYATVRSYGGAERVTFTDLSGFGGPFTLADALAE